MMTTTPPRWDLTNVYPSLESKEFESAVTESKAQLDAFEKFLIERINKEDPSTPVAELGALLGEVVERFNILYDLMWTITPYIQSFVSTDSHNTLAMKIMSEYEMVMVRAGTLWTQFQIWIGKLAPLLEAAIETNQTCRDHAFILKYTAEQARYLMSDAEETLAAQLSLSGSNAWSKLQGTITSQLTVDFELDDEVKKLPMAALISVQHTHPDEAVRRRAYEAEIKAWDSVREPLAACMNGVKGSTNVLNKRRGREDALHSAIDDARIDRATLEAMLGAMESSFSAFHKYFKTKARRFGKDKLAWWDLFAPLGSLKNQFSWEEACALILVNFRKFSPELEAFAKRAFNNNWIDAEVREGKDGGGFCMGVSGVKESRVLCNFDGSLDEVSTIAHELGHAFHNECAFNAGKTILQRELPMTLAETASIMCDTIVMEAVLAQSTNPQEELAILERQLVNDAQVIVDIYSRYLFEREIFIRREKSELSADDLCEAMERAQKATYGDGLDENYLHKYMWAWKSHYYGMSFYNFPYAFGLLFSTGLYVIYQQRGPAFVEDFKKLLASTGEASAADLAARFGIDIHSRKFWEDSLALIAKKIDRYCEL
jgi:pepF/M3 family oligoendopeptidase